MGSYCSSQSSTQVHDNQKVNNVLTRKKAYIIPQDQLSALPLKPPKTLTHFGIISDFVIQSSQNSKSPYDEILQKLKEGQGQMQYQDPSFPPTSSSIISKNNLNTNGAFNLNSLQQLSNKILWKRPQNFLPDSQQQKANVFSDKVSSNDIIQGALQDSYLLSAVSALIENAKLLKRLFISTEPNQYGCYSIWLCCDGEWEQCVIDDNFPCHEDSGPAFAKTRNNDIYLMLLEKVYAKAYGAYDRIQMGLAGHTLRDLSGAPYQYFVRDFETHLEPDEIWQQIEENLKKGYIILFSKELNSRRLPLSEEDQQQYMAEQFNVQIEEGQSSRRAQQSIENSNAVGNNNNDRQDNSQRQFSYTVLECHTVVDSSGKQDRIIKLRNSLRKIDWQGDWSDSSNRWTPDLIQTIKLQKKETEAFWINVTDACKQFSQLCISKLHPNYVYTSLAATKAPLTEKTTARLFSMRVFQKTHAFISVSQKDTRHHLNSSSIINVSNISNKSNSNNQKKVYSQQYAYSLVRLVMAKVSSEDRSIESFVGQGYECERDVHMEVELESGEYMIYVDLDWVQDFVRDFTISCYSAQAVALNELKWQEKMMDSVVDALIECHQVKEDQERLHKYNDFLFRTTGSFCGYIYFYYQNNSDSTVLKEDVQMKERRFLSICSPQKNSEGFSLYVNPGERKIVKYRVEAEGRGEYLYQTQISYILLEKMVNDDVEKLKDLALNNPSKVKQREMNGHFMEVYVHTFVYFNGVCFLYVNKTRSKTYVEDLELELENLSRRKILQANASRNVLEVGDGQDDNKIHIEVPAGETYLVNLHTINAYEEISYSMKMSYFLR